MTGHTLVIGLSGHGKTTIVKIIARKWIKRGGKILTLDPMIDPEWEEMGCTLFSDADKFLHAVKRNTNHLVVVDEGGTAIGKHEPQLNFLTTTARHLGHATIVIAHKPTQLPTVLRENCDRLFLFNSRSSVREMILDDWGDERVLTEDLPNGHFLWLELHKPTRKGTIDYRSMTIKIVP